MISICLKNFLVTILFVAVLSNIALVHAADEDEDVNNDNEDDANNFAMDNENPIEAGANNVSVNIPFKQRLGNAWNTSNQFIRNHKWSFLSIAIIMLLGAIALGIYWGMKTFYIDKSAMDAIETHFSLQMATGTMHQHKETTDSMLIVIIVVIILVIIAYFIYFFFFDTDDDDEVTNESKQKSTKSKKSNRTLMKEKVLVTTVKTEKSKRETPSKRESSTKVIKVSSKSKRMVNMNLSKKSGKI